MVTDTTIPIKNGLSSVALIINKPIAFIKELTYGPIKSPTNKPTRIVMLGVIIISSLVDFETSFPNSTPKIVARKTPTGPPSS